MSQNLLVLTLLLVLGWSWPRQAQAYTETHRLEVREDAHGLVINLAGEGSAQSQSDMTPVQPELEKVKAKARRKVWPRTAPDAGVSAETRQRLYELQQLDALRSASPR